MHESIFDEVADRLVDYAKNELKYGYPDDEATNFGPVVSDEHRDKVLSYYKLAEEEGAAVLHGGGAPTFGDERDGRSGSNSPSGRASPTTAGWPPRRSSDLPLR